MNKEKVKLFAVESARVLGTKIAKHLDLKLCNINKTIFADGEIIVQAEETVRNQDVFFITDLSHRPNDTIMETLLFIDSLKRASANSINVIISYYAYSRQDRKADGRQPIGAKLLADMLEKAGATKIIAVDLHNPSIQGFFNIPLDDLKSQYSIAKVISQIGKFTVMSPDHGGAVRARLLSELISNTIQIAIVDKRRVGPNEAITNGVLGDVKNRNVVILDDMIDTGGTIIKAAEIAKEHGAKKVFIVATHGLFNKGFEMFDKNENIDKVIVTDTVGRVHDIKSEKLEIVSLSKLFAISIDSTISGNPISQIYKDIKADIEKNSL